MEPTAPVSSSPSSSSSPPQSSSGSTSSVTSQHDKTDEACNLSSDAADQSTLRHPKGKRKRTASKDKAILEAAYLANPKPDKTARLDIVSQVSLNEKEVQIWFQNRRQNDRRKSRPLTPEEVAALRYGGMHALSSDSSLPFARASLSQHSSFSDSPGTPDGSFLPYTRQAFSSASMTTGAPPSTTPLSSPELGPWMPEALARNVAQVQEPRQQQQPQQGAVYTPSAPSSFSNSVSSVGSVGYLANRWNMQSTFSTPSSLGRGGCSDTDAHVGAGDEPVKLDPCLPPAPSVLPPPVPRQQQQRQLPPPQLQPKQQRPFRLSLSLDGKAEVTAQSPSPPRHQPIQHKITATSRRMDSSSSDNSQNPLPSLPAIHRAGLTRSHSALPGIGLTLPPISSLTSSLTGTSSTSSMPTPKPEQPSQSHVARPHFPPRLLRHRSRDAQAWESVCDAETRLDDELSAHAQQEANGSAIAAISLIRSTSSTLQPNAARRNTALPRAAASRPGGKRAKLGRAASSVARMQSVPFVPVGNSHINNMAHRGNAKTGKPGVVDEDKKKTLKLSTLLSGNDSDKENWSPDEEGQPLHRHNPNGRRPLPSSNAAVKKALLEKTDNAALLAKRRQAGGKVFDGLDIYEDPASSPSAGGAENKDGRGGKDFTPRKRRQLARAATLPVGPAMPAAAEAERFMRGAEVSPSKKGDLDCVAGLLSLSQGNWR